MNDTDPVKNDDTQQENQHSAELNEQTLNNVGNDETSLALEILCNQVENENNKVKEDKERKMMNLQLDIKLARI